MMNVKQIFDLGLKMGIKADPRGEKGVREFLNRQKKEYEDLKPEEKKYFDPEKLVNPFPDSGIHVSDDKTAVKRVLAGIDIGSSEIILATQLNERGKKIDLVIAHHPVGKTLADLHGMLDMQVDIYESFGIPVHVAEKLMEERIKEVGRSLHPINHFQLIDMARILNVNLLNTHTITDNLVQKYLTNFIAKRKPRTVNDLMKILLEIPEYQEGKKRGAGPKLFCGSPRNRLGKVMVEMTGGTNPSNKIYEELSRVGVSTMVGMHIKDEAMEKASEKSMNVVIAGHISSDSLGMNLFLDELEKKGIEVVPCGGLIRVKRGRK